LTCPKQCWPNPAKVVTAGKTLRASPQNFLRNSEKKAMFDIISTLMWVALGVGVFAVAFVEYRFSAKKRTSKA